MAAHGRDAGAWAGPGSNQHGRFELKETACASGCLLLGSSGVWRLPGGECAHTAAAGAAAAAASVRSSSGDAASASGRRAHEHHHQARPGWWADPGASSRGFASSGAAAGSSFAGRDSSGWDHCPWARPRGSRAFTSGTATGVRGSSGTGWEGQQQWEPCAVPSQPGPRGFATTSTAAGRGAGTGLNLPPPVRRALPPPPRALTPEEEESLGAATELIQMLSDCGHLSLIAGGWVRDRFAGVPAADIDIATSASVTEMHRALPGVRVQQLHPNTARVTHKGYDFELTTFKGRRRTADDKGAHLDACKRDFTINSLFYDPLRQEVLDFVGAVDDIHAKVLRMNVGPWAKDSLYVYNGDLSVLQEDPVRILRGVRFMLQFGLAADPATMDHMRTCVASCVRQGPMHIGYLARPLDRQLTSEARPARVWRELAKIAGMEPSRPGSFSTALRLCQQIGLLALLFPFLKDSGPASKAWQVHQGMPVSLPLELRVASLADPFAGLTALVEAADLVQRVRDSMKEGRPDAEAVQVYREFAGAVWGLYSVPQTVHKGVWVTLLAHRQPAQLHHHQHGSRQRRHWVGAPSTRAPRAAAPPRALTPEEEESLGAATELIRMLSDCGHLSLIVGGWVRDRFAGMPASGIDIATSASATEMRRALPGVCMQQLHPNTARVTHKGHDFDLTTFKGHRHTADDEGAHLDACKRDFTINSLFYDPLRQEVWDYVRAVDDIHAKVLCMNVEPWAQDSQYVYDGDNLSVLQEDPIQILRGVRFMLRFGLTADPATMDHMRTCVASCVRKGPMHIGYLARPSDRQLTSEARPSRVWRELAKIAGMKPSHPGSFSAALRLSQQIGLLALLFPFLKDSGPASKAWQVHQGMPVGLPLELRVASLADPFAGLTVLVEAADLVQTVHKGVWVTLLAHRHSQHFIDMMACWMSEMDVQQHMVVGTADVAGAVGAEGAAEAAEAAEAENAADSLGTAGSVGGAGAADAAGSAAAVGGDAAGSAEAVDAMEGAEAAEAMGATGAADAAGTAGGAGSVSGDSDAAEAAAAAANTSASAGAGACASTAAADASEEPPTAPAPAGSYRSLFVSKMSELRSRWAGNIETARAAAGAAAQRGRGRTSEVKERMVVSHGRQRSLHTSKQP
ncbi:hypothetical protein FOA52_012117 [Chlamydomonas sp. UWO 241]|nr:hypothetical protein FOA52_012117 [Chlamydomonas sp. UWO 241]